MTNKKITIERLLSQSRDRVEIPSRTEFSSLMNNVTHESINRNTPQKGIKSPFIIIMNITKNKLVLAGSVALLAIIVIIPTVRHQRIVATPMQNVGQEAFMPTDEQSVAVIQESKGAVSEDIVADIMKEFNEEDAVTQQELADDGYIESDYEVDSAING